MSWLKRILPKVKFEAGDRREMPEGVWAQCPKCENTLYTAQLHREHKVCSKCGHHLRLSAHERLAFFLDDIDSARELAGDTVSKDRLKFKRYKDTLHKAHKKTGQTDALVVMQGDLLGMPVVAMAFEFGFIGGSMGPVVGQRFLAGVNESLRLGIPLVCFSASGGARMQEGLISLLQMAKTSAALAKLSEAGIPFISVLTDPTMGGVSASLAMLGDLILAEPDALIGFAGPRVIEQTVREVLPEGFQRSEFLLEKGSIDQIVARSDQRERIYQLLTLLQGKTTSQAS